MAGSKIDKHVAHFFVDIHKFYCITEPEAFSRHFYYIPPPVQKGGQAKNQQPGQVRLLVARMKIESASVPESAGPMMDILGLPLLQGNQESGKTVVVKTEVCKHRTSVLFCRFHP